MLRVMMSSSHSQPPGTTSTPLDKPGTRPMPIVGHGECLLGQEEIDLVTDVISRKQLFRYYAAASSEPPPMVARFERELREKIGVDYALAVTSGTAALEVALAALGIGPGDEVIVPAWSWISCFTVIARAGARPVLAEVDDSLNLDPSEIDRLLTPRTRAVFCVHFQGVAANIDAILEKTRQAGIMLVEDCASSVGASYRGGRVGSFGDISIFSFQNNKTITGGEGGAVVTNDARLYERAVRMHDVGQFRPYHQQFHQPSEIAFCGVNYRMSELTAAVLVAQLRKLDPMIDHLRSLAKRLHEGVCDLPGIEFRHLHDPEGQIGLEYYLRLPDNATADRFREALSGLGIACVARTGTYMQYARDYVIHRHCHNNAISPFRDDPEWPAVGYRPGDFPKSNAAIDGLFAVPISALYTESDIDFIIDALRWAHQELIGTTSN